MEVLCGNLKLMDYYEILKPYPLIKTNIQNMEQEGKTVVILVVDEVPQLIISLEEEHLCKPEAKQVITYFQKVLRMQVCMITGDNMHSAFKVANHLGINHKFVTYSAYPETKRQVVMMYQD